MLRLVSLSDSMVLERIKKGDEKMILHLYNQNQTMVKNFVLRHNGSEDDAEDVLQESVIAVWQNALKTDFFLDCKLTTYTMAVAKNTWFKLIKKRSKFKIVDIHEGRSLAQNEVASIEKEQIIAAVNNLDETCRKLLSYFYFDQMENQLIAEKMGFANTNTVKSKKYQCFKKLQDSVLKKFQKDDLI